MSEEPEQVPLFDKGEWWEEQWKGMPEFVQNDMTPFATVYVHFRNREDVDKFAKLIQQNITPNTQYVWYPEATLNDFTQKRYVDDSSIVSNEKGTERTSRATSELSGNES